MNRMSLICRSLLIAVVLTFGIGCSSKPQPLVQQTEVVHAATVATQRANIPDLLEASGTVHAAQTSELASQMMGNIVEIRVQEGDRVQRGQVLAVIDDSQSRAEMNRANAADNAAQQQLVASQADLGLAESTLRRYQSLYDKKSVSPQEFDEVKARQQAAIARRDMARAGQAQSKAVLTQSRTSVEFTRIRAPFDGLVTERRADPGTLAAPGTPVFTIEDLNHYRLEAAVNENDLRYVRMGQMVQISLDALNDAKLNGKVIQIVPAADSASRSFLVKIKLPRDTRLRTGLFGRAAFSRGERSSLLIPRTAVVERGQLQGVYVLDRNKVADLRYVTLGQSSGTDIEVLAGLQDGERLVAKPAETDLSGKRVEAE